VRPWPSTVPASRQSNAALLFKPCTGLGWQARSHEAFSDSICHFLWKMSGDFPSAGGKFFPRGRCLSGTVSYGCGFGFDQELEALDLFARCRTAARRAIVRLVCTVGCMHCYNLTTIDLATHPRATDRWQGSRGAPEIDIRHVKSCRSSNSSATTRSCVMISELHVRSCTQRTAADSMSCTTNA
jgi:hypothetical protein